MTVHVGWLIGVAAVLSALLVGSLAYLWILYQRALGLLNENSEMKRQIMSLEREISNRIDKERRAQRNMEEQFHKKHERELRELQEQHKRELREGRAKSKRAMSEKAAKKRAEGADKTPKPAPVEKPAVPPCEAPPAPISPPRVDPEQVSRKEYERVIRESESREKERQAEIDRLTEVNRELSARLEVREQPKSDAGEEKDQRLAELQDKLEKRAERAAELFNQNKRLRVGMDGLIEDLREARGADSPAYLSEKIEYAISVLGGLVEGSAMEGRDK